MSSLSRRAGRAYVLTSVTGLTALLLLAALNLVLWPAARGPSAERRFIERFGADRLARAYPGHSAEEIGVLLAETTQVRQEYEPFTGFRPIAIHGRFLTVLPPGFRAVKEQSPWPPRVGDDVIFFFGGSTAFGIGVSDEETIPSRLQELLRARHPRVSVYDFGRPSFISSQERILFEQLLISGFRPRIAIFMDGLNEFLFRDDPTGPFVWSASDTEALRRLTSESHQFLRVVRSLTLQLPAVRLLSRLRRARGAPEEPRSSAESVVTRYLGNSALIQAVSKAFGMTPLFVWQPIAASRYDVRYHLFADAASRPIFKATAGFDLVGPETLSEPGLWLADMQEGRRENLYVDPFHYNAAFSREIAARIADRVEALLAAP